MSNQQLSDGATGKGYVMFGFSAERMWKHFNVFLNAETFSTGDKAVGIRYLQEQSPILFLGIFMRQQAAS